MTFRIAAICTQYYPFSHADVIVTRWLEPHVNDAHLGFAPTTQIASLYVAQHPHGDPPSEDWFTVSPNGRAEQYDPRFDISRLVSEHYGVPIYPTIRQALTLGGDRLAVDAVLLIAEHGDYPFNEYRQKLYPRKELFDEVVALFREWECVVPLFCDKHLSWNMDWARAMIATVQVMNIPFFGGSSAPITGPARDLALPPKPELVESLGLFAVGAEVYGIHSMEFVQSFIERRRGGESGIVAMTAYTGNAVWAAMERGAWSSALFDATLAACPTALPGDYRANCVPNEWTPVSPVAVVCEHADGHQQTHVMLNGHIEDFAVGLRLRDDSTLRVSAAAMAGLENFVVNFAHLDREIERFFLTRQSPVPLERLLLTTLEVATFMHVLQRPGQRIETPHLRIAYHAN